MFPELPAQVAFVAEAEFGGNLAHREGTVGQTVLYQLHFVLGDVVLKAFAG